MAKTPLVIQRFDGGKSTDLKIGPSHSFAYSKQIDFRKSPTQLSVLPAPTKESSTTVTGLITDMIQLPSGKIAAIDSSGGFYLRATDGTWSKNGTSFADTACGMIYNDQFDTIYVAGLNNLHAVTNADGKFSGGTLTVTDNAVTAQVDKSATVSTNTYTTTGTITESATHMLSFTPTIEPLATVKVWVTTKGTGDLVLTLHDAANNVLATKTVANASISNGALNTFTFDTPVRMNAGNSASTYHCHITHPSGTATTIGAATASDFSTARFETHANRFVNPTNGFHPMAQFLQYICIGNGRYLSAWETISQSAPSTSEFVQHRLTFPHGYEVTSLSTWTEYLAIGCEKRSSSAGNEFQDGKIFFWDGTSPTYNFWIDIPDGSPYSLFCHKNVLYYIAGGSLWAWNGGNPVKVTQMPNTDTEYGTANTYIVNYPNMLAVRNGILQVGFPSETNSTTIEHGSYSFGTRDQNFGDSFGYSYVTSNGNNTNSGQTLRLGAIRSFGDKMFIAWREDTTYGVDIIYPTSNPAAAATWESLILDDGRPDKEKDVDRLKVDFATLPTGCTVTPKYKINRASSWTTGTAATAGATQAVLNINKRYKELQVGLDIVCTTATPTIYGITIIRDLLSSEVD